MNNNVVIVVQNSQYSIYTNQEIDVQFVNYDELQEEGKEPSEIDALVEDVTIGLTKVL